jgi:hypothetical protein
MNGTALILLAALFVAVAVAFLNYRFRLFTRRRR